MSRKCFSHLTKNSCWKNSFVAATVRKNVEPLCCAWSPIVYTPLWAVNMNASIHSGDVTRFLYQLRWHFQSQRTSIHQLRWHFQSQRHNRHQLRWHFQTLRHNRRQLRWHFQTLRHRRQLRWHFQTLRLSIHQLKWLFQTQRHSIH